MKQTWKKWIPFVITCFTLGLVGCGGGGGGGTATGCSTLNAKVFNGETCRQDARSPVVALFPIRSDGQRIGPAGICTGTFITLTRILTSAHCFVDPVRQFGRQIVGFGVVAGGTNGEGIAVNGLAIHPSYDGRVGSHFDIAIARLQRAPNPPIGPVPVLLTESTAIGDKVTTFGYGTSNRGEIGTLKAAGLRIEDIGAGNLFATLTTSGASVCPGDSGGPLIKRIRGVSALVGINSFVFGPDHCSNEGALISGFVDVQSSSIVDFISRHAPDAAVE